MINKESFIAKIIEFPRDDGPRLVYADWLEEQGESDRAEFIRVQCELAAIGKPYYQSEHGCKLHARQLNLFCRRGQAWFGDPLGGVVGKPCPNGGNHRKDRYGKWYLCKGCDGSGRIVTDCRVEKAVYNPAPEGHQGENDITYTIARGFVESITLTLATFVGGVCERCSGEGEIRSGHPMSWPDCKLCSGSGRNPGHAATIFAAQPVVRVVCEDAITYRDYGGGDERPAVWRHTLGDELWFILCTDPSARDHWFVEFATRKQAINILSVALVSYGRQLVGLPPITQKT